LRRRLPRPLSRRSSPITSMLRRSWAPNRHGRACPGLPRPIHVGPLHRPSPRCWRPIGKPWASAKPNHVDGRDEPGHDGKWHGKQDLTSLFLVSSALAFGRPL
jgi:hypothetical protein